jgi:hypothetical protein
MRAVIRTATLLSVLVFASTFVEAQRPRKKNARPAQRLEESTAAVTGNEEAELANPSVPQPSSAQLPNSKYEFEDYSKNPLRGTFSLGFSAGLYNFENKTENPQTKTSRTYTLPFDYTTLIGIDLAFRMGKDSSKDHDSRTGFHYYRSNKGIFTDFEMGLKFQRTENKPTRFNFQQSSPTGSVDIPVDLGYDYSTGTSGTTGSQNLTTAGITPQLRQAVGGRSVEVTMFNLNTYYHLTYLNNLFNWGEAFRWFDASMGPSLRVWYYRDASDLVRIATRDDDWTYATLMLVYRQYIQFHPMVRLRSHFYFPALSYFGQLAKSPMFNETEYILNSALEVYAFRIPSVGLIVSAGYEGHWWNANPYSSDRYVRSGFAGDNGATNASYAGFEHKTRTSWEGFVTVTVEFHFGPNGGI